MTMARKSSSSKHSRRGCRRAIKQIGTLICEFYFIMRVLLVVAYYYILNWLGYDENISFQQCVRELGELNMFFVKAFQSLSTNTRMLSQEQIDFLTVYTDDVPFEKSEVNPEFIDSIQQTCDQYGYNCNFDDIALYNPMKSGMIALVYRAKLDSRDIVIKVMRKGVKRKLTDALRKVNLLVSLLNYIPSVKNFQLTTLLSENWNSLLLQTDFVKEMNNMQQMYDNCRHTSYLAIPRVYHEFTQNNNSVIVMTYLEGRKLEELQDNEKDKYSLLVAKFGMKCLLFNRFYHADLHPGNILFMKDGKEYRIGILDYGVMGEITKEEQDAFYRFILCLSKTKDYKTMADIIIDELVSPVNSVEKLEIYDRNMLHEELGIVVGTIFDTKRSMSANDIYRINEVLRKYGVCLSRSFCKIELSLAIADSVTEKLSYNSSYIDNVKLAIESVFDNNFVYT